MKDQIKPVDFSILSTYMGKWLTAIMAVFVIGVAISAFITGGGGGGDIVRIGVHIEVGDADTLEPLRRLISSETRRAALVGVWDDGEDLYDLYILPAVEFVRVQQRLDLQPLYELTGPLGSAEGAVLVARRGDDVDLAGLAPSDVTFPHVSSVNGFLLPLSLLTDAGFDPPSQRSAVHFGGSGGHGARLIFSVVSGDYRVAGCRQRDLSALVEAGVVGEDELVVLKRRSPLPEYIIAGKRGAAPYYQRALRRVARTLENAGDARRSSREYTTVRLLQSAGINGLHAVDPAAVDEVRELSRRYASLFTTAGE